MTGVSSFSPANCRAALQQGSDGERHPTVPCHDRSSKASEGSPLPRMPLEAPYPRWNGAHDSGSACYVEEPDQSIPAKRTTSPQPHSSGGVAGVVMRARRMRESVAGERRGLASHDR